MILGIVLGYLAISLAVGWRAGKGSSASSDGFVAGDRTLGTFVMYFITGATIFSAFAFLGQPAAVYTKGASAFALLGYGCLGFVPFYWLGPRAARVGRAYGYVTQGEMVAGRFQSPALAIVMALVAIVAFVPYLALQMQGAGIVLEAITGGDIGPDVGAALVYGVVLMYVWRSGVLGVGWTNALQGILMMVLAWILGLTVPELMHGGVDEMFDGLVQRDPKMLVPPGYTGTPEPGVVAPWTWSQYSSRLVVMMIGFSFWPHLFMKAFTARNGDVLRRTVVLYPTFLLFLVPIFLLGFAAIGMENPPASADGILPHLILNLDLSPVLVGGLDPACGGLDPGARWRCSRSAIGPQSRTGARGDSRAVGRRGSRQLSLRGRCVRRVPHRQPARVRLRTRRPTRAGGHRHALLASRDASRTPRGTRGRQRDDRGLRSHEREVARSHRAVGARLERHHVGPRLDMHRATRTRAPRTIHRHCQPTDFDLA